MTTAHAPASPDRQAFLDGWDAGRPQVRVRRLVNDLETPVSAYLKVGLGRPYAFLLESVEGGEVNGRYSILTLSPDRVWRCRDGVAETARRGDVEAGVFTPTDTPALDSLRRLIADSRFTPPGDLPPMCAGLFGVFGYDMVRLVEPLGPARPDPLDLPDAVLTRPGLIAVFDSVRHEIILTAPAYPDADLGVADGPAALAACEARLDAFEAALATPLPVGPAPTRPDDAADFTAPVDARAFADRVERAREYIRAGDVFQVVLSHRMDRPFEAHPFSAYRALRRQNPSPYLYFLDLGEACLAGSSPEILVRLKDGEITIRPLAGTRPRGDTPEADRSLEAELLADPKERAEHLMLLDLGRNDVGRVSTPGSVRVAESFRIERYSQVMHIVSDVRGRADPSIDAADTLLAALPAGTLSGAPKVRAMQVIDELETGKRGVGYGGGVGYIAAGGDADICIVLRTLLFAGGRAHVQAGAGIVADSDPAAEYAETLAKARAPMAAAAEAWRFPV